MFIIINLSFKIKHKLEFFNLSNSSLDWDQYVDKKVGAIRNNDKFPLRMHSIHIISSVLIKFGINWQRRDFNNLLCLHFTLLYEYDCQIVLRNIETPLYVDYK